MEERKCVITGDSITVVWKGKTHSVQRGAPNFEGLRRAILEDRWDDVPGFFTVALSIETWAKGRFKVSPDKKTISYDDQPLPRELNERILRMVSRGDSPEPFFNFWERLQRNPSWRSVQQLWPFLAKEGIPLTPEGRFWAYKGLTRDFKDVHTRTVDNRPGTINKMPRNKISDDPNQACHYGFHVGAESYAKGFSEGQVVICEVDPEHVVCVPYDSSQEKMRVCEYKVIGNDGMPLPSTVYYPEDDIEDEDDIEEEVEDEDLDDEEDDIEDEDEETDKPDDAEDDENWEEDGKTPKKSKSMTYDKPPKGFAKLHKMGFDELVNQSIAELRKYAGKGLKIVGASKIPGGRTTLAKRIVEVRDGKAKSKT